ncbi:MAG: hypothetical protein AAF707_05115 [Pseudomonadota bacterium]
MAGPLTSNNVEALTGKRRAGSGNRLKFFSDVFPYLLVPVIAYTLVAVFADGPRGDGSPAIRATLDAAALTIPMLSGVIMRITWGELMVIFAVVFLFVEVIKSTNTASAGIVNHILSMILFVLCLMQFLMFASFATGTFFIITAMVLVDALAGMVVTIISARRDFGVEGF